MSNNPRANDWGDLTRHGRIKNIRKRLESATKGPWEWYNGCSWWRLGLKDDQTQDGAVLRPYVCRDGHPDIVCKDRDREFIEHSPTDVKYLLEREQKMWDAARTIVSELLDDPAARPSTISVMRLIDCMIDDDGE